MAGRSSYAALVIFAAGCGRLGFDARPVGDGGDMLTDVRSPDASLPSQPFMTPVALTVLNSAGEDDDPTLPDDQLEIYFATDRTGNGDIFRATRASKTDPWSAPAPVTELNTLAFEQTPELSADGLTMYFSRVTTGNHDVFVTTRASRTAPWSPPTRVPELSTSGFDDDGAAPAPDGRTILVSQRDRSTDMYTLWIATRPDTSSAWNTLTRVTELDEPGGQANQAWLGEHAVFYTLNTASSQELRAALRVGPIGFGAPVAIPELDLPGQQSDPWLSSDLETIYFESENDLYMATRAP